jgi:ubiquinol-cytochrome c reductase cytochrome b subunit
VLNRLIRWFDDRLGGTRFTRKALDKVFPDHWSFMLGEIALYCFVVLVLTGIFLAFFFHASAQDVVYRGSYAPLAGVHMSEAYRSTVDLSFDVRAGLVIRQIHHWAALVFVGAIVLHLCRIFFTGAYRRPREINWIVGVTLLILAIANGFAGYSLPDDLLSGTGLRIAYSVVMSVPVIGSYLAFFVFGGEFPASDITSRLYIIHVLIVPALIAVLLSVHLAVLWRQKHTQFPGKGRTERNVVGSRLWPVYTLRSIGLFCAIVAVLGALGGLVQINPIWLYGPFEPYAVTTAAQPDWYMGWLEGAMRVMPSFQLHLFGYRVPEIVVPTLILPMATFAVLYLWPAVDKRLTSDRMEHHLLGRPRDHPIRSAFGAAVLTFYVVLFVAGSQDVIAQKLGVSIEPVTVALRVLLLVLPVVVAVVSYAVCHDLAQDKPLEEAQEEGEPPVAPAEAPPELVVAGERASPSDGADDHSDPGIS